MISKTQLRDTAEKRVKAMDAERATWETHWQELVDWFLPRKGSLIRQKQRNQGNKRNGNIIDATPTIAHRTAASGLMANLTSPARPWFKMGTRDPGLMQYGPAKNWLNDVEQTMRDIFARSNLYNALHMQYEDLWLFGTSAMSIYDDYEDVVRGYPWPVGEFSAALGPRNTLDTLARCFSYTVRQAVGTFGLENCSQSVKNLWDRGNYEQNIEIAYLCEPNNDVDDTVDGVESMPWRAIYWEVGSPKENILRVAGHRLKPFVVPRGHVANPSDCYGRSPAMEALGDAKQLQLMEKRKAQWMEKAINPPLVGPTALQRKEISVVPGGVTYDDSPGGQGNSFRAAYQVPTAGVDAFLQDIEAVRGRIYRTMYADLFQAISLAAKDMTATEVAMRHDEQLLQVGPISERLHTELLGPVVELVFDHGMAAGVFPEPPEEMQGQALKIEYISTMAQAQKLVGVGAMDKFLGIITAVGQVQPMALDKVDADQFIDEYGNALGVPSRMIRPDEQVAEMREARANQQMAMQQAEMAQRLAAASASAAKAQTPTGEQLMAALA